MTPWKSSLVLLGWTALVLVSVGDEGKSPDDAESKADVLFKALAKDRPENVEDLKAIQGQVKKVLDKVMPCTVGLRLGANNGSGVLVQGGYVLTAGHVSGKPNRDVTVIFPDGKKVKGRTLGANQGIDSGLVKIVEEGEWPFVEMGSSANLKKGDWCIAVGQPGGFRPGRTPPVRVGRILEIHPQAIRTDCTLVGGDSGGPLFDLNGKVIGIHSRIGGPITANIHVPIDTYRETWDRLAQGEVWGGRTETFLGVQLDLEAKSCKISQVIPDSPAEKSGLKPNDVIVKMDHRKISKAEELVKGLIQKKPGDKVILEVLREGDTKTIEVTLAKRTD